MIYIPTHTDTYLYKVTYLHIVKDTACQYVVGIFFRYLQIWHSLFYIPTDTY